MLVLRIDTSVSKTQNGSWFTKGDLLRKWYQVMGSNPIQNT